MTLRFNPGTELERSFRDLCTSERRSLNEQFRIILEAYLTGNDSYANGRPQPTLTVTEEPESNPDKIRQNTPPQDSVTATVNPEKETLDRNRNGTKSSGKRLTAADIEQLSDAEKWDIIADDDAKLSPDAIEALTQFSLNQDPDDEDGELDDPEEEDADWK